MKSDDSKFDDRRWTWLFINIRHMLCNSFSITFLFSQCTKHHNLSQKSCRRHRVKCIFSDYDVIFKRVRNRKCRFLIHAFGNVREGFGDDPYKWYTMKYLLFSLCWLCLIYSIVHSIKIKFYSRLIVDKIKGREYPFLNKILIISFIFLK